MGGGGRGGPRLAFGHRSREKRNRGSSLSCIPLSSLVSSRALSYDRPHPNPPAKIRPVESHAHTFRTSSSGIPFRTGVARPGGVSPAEDERRRLSAVVTADSTSAIVRNHGDANGARLIVILHLSRRFVTTCNKKLVTSKYL